MQIKNLLSSLFGILFVLLLCAAVGLAAFMRSTSPVTAANLSDAQLQTERFMDALCSGDYTTAEGFLNGSPALSLERNHSNALSKTLWNTYVHSLSYQFDGDCYSDGYVLSRNVTVTALDIPTLMSELQKQSAILLANRALALGLDDDYSQDFIMETLSEAAADLLRTKDYTTTYTLTLQLTHTGGQWRILATPSLIALMQGSMGGA